MHHEDGSKVRFRFKGQKSPDGVAMEHLEGIPAHSLTGDEYDALSTEERKAVRDSALYSEVAAVEKAAEAVPPASQNKTGAKSVKEDASGR